MIYLGLGSNLGDRKDNLRKAIESLEQNGFSVSQVSPIVESPAWLKPDADPKWNKPYLNLAVAGHCDQSPEALLESVKGIELALGRNLKAPRWSPRPIDIDILIWEGVSLQTEALTLPHEACLQRPFVMTPLLHINPSLMVGNKTIYAHSLKLTPVPLWMGIINFTPDSFADGGVSDDSEALKQKLSDWIEEGVHILDIGAESTRPNAQSLSPDEEWGRLKPALSMIKKLIMPYYFKPLISIDTRHAEVAEKALAYGVDWLNDVTGLNEPKLQSLVKKNKIQAIAMHSTSVPVIPSDHLDPKIDSVEQLTDWLEQKQKQWGKAGLDIDRILFDPGIGFGKTSLQNQQLLKSCVALRQLGHRILIGHSRKSFMNEFSKTNYGDRDLETLGVSMALCAQGVEVIRVHEPLSHMRAYRAWSHIQS